MTEREFDVALSFAGEQREYVQEVASALNAAAIRFFFDERAAADMWGEDLPVYLDRVYRHGSRFVIVFASAEYAEKVWPRLEFRSALARAITEKGAYILPVRFDDTDLPGLLPTVGYLDARKLSPGEIVEALLYKLEGRTSSKAPMDAARPRMPRIPPDDLNPYAETQSAIRAIRELLTARAGHLRGLVGHAEEREGRFLLRLLRSGKLLYSLDMFLDGGFGDNVICFYGRVGGDTSSNNASNAHGRVVWDRDRDAVVVELFNMSLLPEMAKDYRLTPTELAEAIWNEACDEVERQIRQ